MVSLSRPPTFEEQKILNGVEPGERLISHCHPTRIVRVIDRHDDGMVFHVQQYKRHGAGLGAWVTMSSHASKQGPWSGLPIAQLAAFEGQKKLVRQLQQQVQKKFPPLVRAS